MIDHGVFETIICFAIWIFAVFYSLYNVYLLGEYFNHSDHDVYDYDDFTRGWFGRFRDVSDYEWLAWTRSVLILIPWFALNFCGAEWLRSQKKQESIPVWYCLVTVVASMNMFGSAATAFILFIPLSFFALLPLKHPLVFWLIALLFRRYTPTQELIEDPENYWAFDVACSWLVLKCIAYCAEDINNNRRSLWMFLGFGLYLPSFSMGPLFSFSGFVRGAVAHQIPWNKQRVWANFLTFGRCFVWYLFMIFATHFIYTSAIILRPYMANEMTAWQLGGMGIAMGQFFHLKYVVFYGVPCALAKAEGYETPKPPCCVSRVYLYSFMWRYFDHGLYLFLVRYIYVPLSNLLQGWRFKRLLASIASFVFVYVWHGEEFYVACWAVFNFISVSVESMARTVYREPAVNKWLNEKFSEANQRRLHCLLGAPLMYFSMLANFFFIGSLEIGKAYLNRAISAPIFTTLCVVFYLYGATQTSLTIELSEKRAEMKKRKMNCAYH